VLPGQNDNSAAAAASPTPGPTATPAPTRSYSNAPPFTVDPNASYTATIQTDKGDIVIKLDPKAAPQTVNSFVFLAQNHFYDGLSFQRVQQGVIAQAGAPNADGSGGAGYTLPVEDSSLPHDAGAVATALTVSKGNVWEGSQFYICLVPVPAQNGKDTVFGTVTQGLNILQALPGRDPQQATTPGLTINTITITKS
jgi:cyclophilin family peptidyl-prolyl cis-trans isomerase